MDAYQLFYTFLLGLPFGLCLSILWNFFEHRATFQRIKSEREHIDQEAQEKRDAVSEEYKIKFNNLQKEKNKIFEKEIETIKLKIKDLQSKTDKRAYQLELKKKENRTFFKQTKKEFNEIQKIKMNNLQETKKWTLELKKENQNNIQKIKNHFSIDLKNLEEKTKKDIESDWIDTIRKNLEKQEKQEKQNLKKDSFFYLNMALNRFDRPYCPERGIGMVSFQSNKQLEKVTGLNNIFLNDIEKECGVDILIHKEDLQASVFGIDPVRRELGRMTLQKLSKQKKLDKEMINKTIKNSKKILFTKIYKDGKEICRKLRLKNVAPEVQNMMGALRYRYSFAQNQYFHCEEVGWLCGLLNSELNLSIKSAQRAGMFHDIGKAMDHSIEGSHAVIGADFLSKYKEQEEILHPVRAHHHDEVPSTALAYLVIVADAISGSRPGARRFTEYSYNQKMANLERIIDSFDNIEDAYIMSAGREMRVIVDNKKISDKDTLELSKQIARKIEKECSYPGLIKVTVVRHSEKVATA